MDKPDIRKVLDGLIRQQQSGAAIDSPHYISLTLIDKWLREMALPEARGVMLDYGCGGQPYRELFTPRLTQYIGADVATAHGVRLDLEIVPGQPVPLPDASVDTLLSTQTLEHVQDVEFYASECGRLARPGASLILTAPMQWRHHEVPYDYLRFTKYGVGALLERHGFEIRSALPCGGVYALLGQIFLSHRHELGKGNKRVNAWVNRLALWLDRRYPDMEDTLNWMCIAVRKSPT